MTNNETTFEEFITQYLIETNGFEKGKTADFDKGYAMDTELLWKFLNETQASELSRFQGTRLDIFERISKKIKDNGIIDVLRGEIEVQNIKLKMFYPKPSKSDGQSAWNCYASNIFSVTRQVTYSKLHPGNEIDFVVFVNGLPIITTELKYSHSGQRASREGISQYKTDRDPKDTLLGFGRCLAHFAVDDNEIFFTTKLAGERTYFMPFNKGLLNGQGAGNPPNINGGYKTHYFWERVLTKEVLADIINNYVLMDYGDKDKERKVVHIMKNAKKLIFPRYHQLDVVDCLLNDVSARGVGKTYLIQHSAGSGKSNSITWLANKVINVCPQTMEANRAKALDKVIFSSAIVVTDRRVLDNQLKNNINAFVKTRDFVVHADTSSDLKKAIEKGKRIIITTIQKFPFIYQAIGDVSDKNFAIIIDEAHSSQTGVASDRLNSTFQKDSALCDGDTDSLLLKLVQDSKMSTNCSYFAFTATPKPETLERFGNRNADGGFDPFHLYSMKQAIEEGFILDVLKNYMSYKSFYEVSKIIKDNPKYKSARAQKQLKNYVESNPDTIEVKAKIMLEHFVNTIVKPGKLKGHAKAMVVTQDIARALEYYSALCKLLKNIQGQKFKILVSYSGEKEYDGDMKSESDINGFSADKTPDYFDDDEYRILVVANKYLTGFDQPKLLAMYIDKKLEGVLAVQTLSRLNRTCPEYGKTSNDLVVLDFYNDAQSMRESFEPYYTEITLTKPTDVNVLYDICDQLLGYEIYDNGDIDDFITKFVRQFEQKTWETPLDIVAQRFNVEKEFDNDTKADIKAKLKQFVKIYSRMRAILPYEVLEWEKFYWFARLLIPKLLVKSEQDSDLNDILQNVNLSTYGLSKSAVEAIILDNAKTEVEPPSNNVVQVPGQPEKDPLDQIVQSFNKKWFSKWKATPDDQKVKILYFRSKIWSDDRYKNYIQDNPDIEEVNRIFTKIIDDIVRKSKSDDMSFYKEFFGNRDFRDDFIDTMINMSSVVEYRKYNNQPFSGNEDWALQQAAEGTEQYSIK